MAATRKPAAPTTQAAVSLLPTQRSCLLNLPASLVQVLLNSNVLAQDVVVELSWRGAPSSTPGGKVLERKLWMGWSGMQARSASGGLRTDSREKERELQGVEVDAVFGRLVGLGEGMKVSYTSIRSSNLIVP